MCPFFVFLLLGLLFFRVEVWCCHHTWVHFKRYFPSESDVWEKYGFKNVHMIAYIIANVIPIVNAIVFVCFFIFMYVDSTRRIFLVPPEGTDEELKPSKLDKWLNKTI